MMSVRLGTGVERVDLVPTLLVVHDRGGIPSTNQSTNSERTSITSLSSLATQVLGHLWARITAQH